MSGCGCYRTPPPNPKYVVRERANDAYKFSVAKDLGIDAQGGHWFHDVALFTWRPAAESACRQLNLFDGVLYLPGKCAGSLTIGNEL